MMDLEIQQKIDKLYADMKPLMEEYGTRPKTIDERYQAYLKKKAELEAVKAIARPRFKLPKL